MLGPPDTDNPREQQSVPAGKVSLIDTSTPMNPITNSIVTVVVPSSLHTTSHDTPLATPTPSHIRSNPRDPVHLNPKFPDFGTSTVALNTVQLQVGSLFTTPSIVIMNPCIISQQHPSKEEDDEGLEDGELEGLLDEDGEEDEDDEELEEDDGDDDDEDGIEDDDGEDEEGLEDDDGEEDEEGLLLDDEGITQQQDMLIGKGMIYHSGGKGYGGSYGDVSYPGSSSGGHTYSCCSAIHSSFTQSHSTLTNAPGAP